MEEILFPYEKIRDIQDTVIRDIHDSLRGKKNIIIHAPTGIGKTASALAPALSFAIEKDLTIFFLTSRQTQHKIAVDTLKQIRKKHGTSFGVADLIGKKWMCLQELEAMNSGDFIEYCKKLREGNECEFYLNSRKSSRLPTVQADKLIGELKVLGPMHVNEVIDSCRKPKLCPYEMTSMLAKDAKVIIADYNAIFNPIIRDGLLTRTEKKLENSIIIIDEGHNLPSRARELLTYKLSTKNIERAIKEALKYELFNTAKILKSLNDTISELSVDLNFNKEEKLIRKYEFIDKINENWKYEDLIQEMTASSELVKEKQKQSIIGGIGKFLESWQLQDAGFARILTMDSREGSFTLNYRCLDPSLVTRDAIDRSYSTIIMSGTLTPTSMYRDILGFGPNTEEKFYTNPFPKENRLSLIVPETTTKFTRRNDHEFTKIAGICNRIITKIPGNAAIFFPSYNLRDQIHRHLYKISNKKILIEKQNLSKEEKEEILEEFKRHKDDGAVLLACSSGNFGEGIDLPGDFLKGVVIVGLPLERPDLETKEVIDYYEDKFGQGINYGYFAPAFTKCLQNAGRCIRTENDKGVIVFLDERFAWENYSKYIPSDMDFHITKIYEDRIQRFFDTHNKQFL
jgi:DNA excision repair protein ERCC-2